MAESAPGSVEALAKAFGFTDTAAFRKRVEQGGLQLDADKAKAFAKELRLIANANGALGEVTQKTRAELNRFLNQLTYAKDEIFKGGMDKGLSYMFSKLAESIENLAPAAKAFGAIFRGVVSVVTGAVKVMLVPFEALSDVISGLWGLLGADTYGIGGKIWSVIGAGGTLALLASKFKLIQYVIGGANVTLLALMRNLARFALLPLLAEDVYSYTQGRDSATGRFVNKLSPTDNPYQNYINRMSLMSASAGLSSLAVEISLKDDADNMFKTVVNKVSQGINSITQTETSQ